MGAARKRREFVVLMVKRALVLAGVGVLVLTAAPAALARRKVVERIIARVNSEIITQRQFERERDKLRQQLAQQFSGDELESKLREFSKDLLRDLIDQALMVQKAKDLDVNIETDLVKRLDEIRGSFNLDSLEALQTEVEKQGLLWEDFKENIRRNLLMREVIGREVGRTIVVSREEARQFFEGQKDQFASPGGVRLAQILISSGDLPPEVVQKKAQEALAELKAGQRWADVAKKYSEDKSTANEGGDIGVFKDGTLAPAIAEHIAKLEVNEFTEPIAVKSGLLILKLLERRSKGVPPFEEVEQQVMGYVYNQRMQPALREFLKTLRKESYIFLAPGFVDTGAERPGDALVARKGE